MGSCAGRNLVNDPSLVHGDQNSFCRKAVEACMLFKGDQGKFFPEVGPQLEHCPLDELHALGPGTNVTGLRCEVPGSLNRATAREYTIGVSNGGCYLVFLKT